MESVRLTYRAKNSHAAGAPWDGVNALNAVIQVRPTFGSDHDDRDGRDGRSGVS